jgi:hypothetical protein
MKRRVTGRFSVNRDCLEPDVLGRNESIGVPAGERVEESCHCSIAGSAASQNGVKYSSDGEYIQYLDIRDVWHLM